MKYATLSLGLAILLSGIAVARAAEPNRNCIRELYDLFGDMTIAKRQCDPKNFVTDPNEYGWVRVPEGCKLERVKGHGAKQPKDAACE